ncbi:MAG: M20 family peptidase [Balneolaceae bacterium]|nr:M20 family peptidase [Balneolaceae bacterium]
MKTFKKILLVLLGVFLTLAVILLVNTFRLGHTQIEPGELMIVEDWDRDAMIDRFSRSLQFQTLSSDEIERDTSEFLAFLDFIEEEFPLVHDTLERTLFGELTPLYYWEGSDPSLDPIMLMGHYDVVPVDSTDIDGWTYEPFSGRVADGYIWGRGAIDNKINVMWILETTEYLLTNAYQPQRGIYFMFGHDEEIGGRDGAREVARYLQDRNENLYFVLDEGGAVLTDALPLDKPSALVGIAEKGYISLELIARTPGGHSSIPPQEMAISELSKAIVKLHQNQFSARLEGTAEKMFDSVASKFPFTFRLIYGNRRATSGLLKRALLSDSGTAAMVRTTIAPTMFRSGVKDNVLPNEARAVVNFRILPGDSFETVKEHVENVIDNDKITIREYASFQISPSPVSGIDGSAYRILQQTIMDRFQDVYVAPYLVMAATDSRYFTTLTDQVYRFTPFMMSVRGMEMIHGTNERVRVEDYEGAIDFYHHLIRMSTE